MTPKPRPSPAADGRLAVVSGGGTGIGRAIVSRLASDGFSVLVLGRRSAPLQEAAGEARRAGALGDVETRVVDVADPDEVSALADALREEGRVVDVIVNNAGSVAPPGPGSLVDVADQWAADYRANVLTAVLLTQGLLPLLRRPGGRIVFIGSMSAHTGGGSPSYGAAKAALLGWARALTARHAQEGITANVVTPGYVPGTGLGGPGGMPPEIHDRVVSRIAAGRPGRPEDAAAVVAFLASIDAGFVTGQEIPVNGGTRPPNM